MRKPPLAAAFVVLVVCGVMVFLFRHESEDDAALGLITRVYRWGRPAFLEVDSNRDGVIDMRGRVAGTFATGVPPVEWWEVPCNLRGFKYHVTLSEGEIVVVESDDQCSGSYTAKYVGEDAKRFYDDQVRPLPLKARSSNRQP